MSTERLSTVVDARTEKVNWILIARARLTVWGISASRNAKYRPSLLPHTIDDSTLSPRRLAHLEFTLSRSGARDSDNAQRLLISAKCLLYRLYHAHYVVCIKPQPSRGEGRRRKRLEKGGGGPFCAERNATGDFVTRSYSWSILGLQVPP